MRPVRLMLLILAVLLAGCAGRSAVPERPVHGVALATLQGGVTVSLESAAGVTGGRGYLFYRRPDTFRLSILSPFGQTVLDLLVAGRDVTCFLPDRKQAWVGTMAELPENLGVRVWPLLQWVVAPPHPAGPALVRTFPLGEGVTETVYYDRQGFVTRKVNSAGDQVAYDDYHVADGVAFPWKVEVTTASGDRLRLLFDEPEVNTPLDEELIRPSLDGMTVLPLREFDAAGMRR